MNEFCSGRRNFLKALALSGAAFYVTNPLLAAAQSRDNKMLVIYFSHSGNTRSVAREIQQFTNAEICEIIPTKPYPENYNMLVELAEKQAAENYRPQFTINPVVNPDSFNVIFLGFPIWAYTMPMIIYSFLDNYKFAGKRIVPFCTHMGSGLADSMQRIKELCPNAAVLPGLAIRGTKAARSSAEVKAWLQKLDIIQQEAK